MSGVTGEYVRRYCAERHVYEIHLQFTLTGEYVKYYVDPRVGRITGLADEAMYGYDRIYFHELPPHP